MITRRLTSKVPTDAAIDPFQAWIVESDTITNINDMTEDADIENEYTPFVKTNPRDVKSQNQSLIDGQAEIFIGKKTLYGQWRTKAADNANHVDLDLNCMINNRDTKVPADREQHHRIHYSQITHPTT